MIMIDLEQISPNVCINVEVVIKWNVAFPLYSCVSDLGRITMAELFTVPIG